MLVKIAVNGGTIVNTNSMIAGSMPRGAVTINGPTEVVGCVSGGRTRCRWVFRGRW